MSPCVITPPLIGRCVQRTLESLLHPPRCGQVTHGESYVIFVRVPVRACPCVCVRACACVCVADGQTAERLLSRISITGVFISLSLSLHHRGVGGVCQTCGASVCLSVPPLSACPLGRYCTRVVSWSSCSLETINRFCCSSGWGGGNLRLSSRKTRLILSWKEVEANRCVHTHSSFISLISFR